MSIFITIYLLAGVAGAVFTWTSSVAFWEGEFPGQGWRVVQLLLVAHLTALTLVFPVAVLVVAVITGFARHGYRWWAPFKLEWI